MAHSILLLKKFTYCNVTHSLLPKALLGILGRQKTSDKPRIIHWAKHILRLLGLGDKMEHFYALWKQVSTLHLSIHSHWAIIVEGENANPMQWWLINLPVSCLPLDVTSSKCGTSNPQSSSILDFSVTAIPNPHRFLSSILDVHCDFILNPHWFRSAIFDIHCDLILNPRRSWILDLVSRLPAARSTVRPMRVSTPSTQLFFSFKGRWSMKNLLVSLAGSAALIWREK